MERLPISKLANSTGQIDGVPANPRTIKKDDYDKLIKSLQEDPDFLNHKPLHVYQQGDKYVVLGGNQRLKALKELDYKEVPCTLYKPETPPEVLRARVMKDNAEFGSWDMDMLANEWSDFPLAYWGVDLPEDWLQDEQEVIRLSDGKDVRQEYLIGMSVPPVMMAQVAHQVYEQLIEVTQ